MQGLFDLRGHVAFVSGASSGLGHHFARTLARAGATVVVGARREDRLDQLCRDIAADGGTAHPVFLDLLDPPSIDAAIDSAANLAAMPTILVNNSGVAVRATAVDMTVEQWDQVVNTNLRGTWLLSRAFGRALIAAGRPGVIVNIASILGIRVVAECSSYNSSKAGIIQLTRSMALELADKGIRVNAICPGYIETDMNREFFRTEAGQKRKNTIPQKRLGRFEDLDGPLLLLASPASGFMTGSVIVVDGGHLVSSL